MKRIYTDLLRVGILMVLVGFLLYLFDESNVVVFQATGIGLFFVGATHLTRRILFPRLDLQAIAINAIKDNNYCALGVFFTIVIFLIAVLAIPLSILK